MKKATGRRWQKEKGVVELSTVDITTIAVVKGTNFVLCADYTPLDRIVDSFDVIPYPDEGEPCSAAEDFADIAEVDADPCCDPDDVAHATWSIDPAPHIDPYEEFELGVRRELAKKIEAMLREQGVDMDDVCGVDEVIETRMRIYDAEQYYKLPKGKTSSVFTRRNFARSHSHSRAHRSPSRSHAASSAKSSDTGDPDSSDPPGPHLRLIPYPTTQSNSSSSSCHVLGCWCMERGRAA